MKEIAKNGQFEIQNKIMNSCSSQAGPRHPVTRASRQPSACGFGGAEGWFAESNGGGGPPTDGATRRITILPNQDRLGSQGRKYHPVHFILHPDDENDGEQNGRGRMTPPLI